MIIQCEQCLTRFKIPDEKVTPKGVKVRCAKCQHTFRVFPEGGGPPVAEADPFALFGPSDGGSASPPPPSPEPAASSEGADPFGLLPGTDPFGSPFAESPPPGPPALPTPPARAAAPADTTTDSSFGLELDFGKDPGTDHSLFEMPPPAPAAPEPPPAPESTGGLLADIPDLGPSPQPVRPRPTPPPRAPTNPGLAAPPAAATPAVPAAFGGERPPVGLGVRVVQTFVAATLFALIAGAGVIVLNGGTLPRLGAGGRTDEAKGEVRVSEVLSGLYETQNGKQLLFVRGQVRNSGGGRAERARVRVELREGTQTVRWGQILAGSQATPEDLYRVTTPADAEALRVKLESNARAIEPGATAPFLLTFHDYPPETDGLTVHVTVQPEAVAAATPP